MLSLAQIDAFGNTTRINNVLSNLPTKLVEAKEALGRIENQQQAAKAELDKPFTLASELEEKELKLSEINTQLNIGGESDVVESMDENEIADKDIDVATRKDTPKLGPAGFLKSMDEDIAF